MHISWLIGGYLPGVGGLLPFAGIRGDGVGRTTMLAIGLGALAAASILCAPVRTLAVLLPGRAHGIARCQKLVSTSKPKKVIS